jgi:sulfatase modifying factor 1
MASARAIRLTALPIAWMLVRFGVGCEAFFPLGDLGPGPADAQVPDATDAGATRDGCAPAAGPAMIQVGAFCIDATEVTSAEYAIFYNAKNGNTSGQPSYCAWNNSYLPDAKCGQFPSNDGTLPIACVDFCDAYAYCAWAGKHLCGQVDGGPSSVSNAAAAGVDAWYTACSHSGAQGYPYGDTYDPTACNGPSDAGAGGAAPVGTFKRCVGGYPGIFDMSGNVGEWTDSCDTTAGANDTCRPRGGSFEGSASALACSRVGQIGRQETFTDTGFRCCLP